MRPIKNEVTEQFAQDLAKAIKNENKAEYDRLMQSDSNPMDKMVRWELLAFKDRVHYLVENM